MLLLGAFFFFFFAFGGLLALLLLVSSSPSVPELDTGPCSKSSAALYIPGMWPSAAALANMERAWTDACMRAWLCAWCDGVLCRDTRKAARRT